MRRHYRFGLSAVCLIWGLIGLGPVSAYPGDEVNGFFKDLVATMKKEDTRAEHLAELVAKNRGVAEKCLLIMKKRADTAPDKAAAYQMLSAKLEEILLLTGARLNCSDPVVKRLEQAADHQEGPDDKVFYLSNLARLCPGNAELLIELGSAYLHLRQFGMAEEAYKKALQIRDDPNSRTLLAAAQEELVRYKKSGPVTVAQVRELFQEPHMSPVAGDITRKVEVVNAIQANQIRFDPWSCEIKDEFKEQLKAVGEVARSRFRDATTAGLLIEGHTDRRGPLDRNEKLSWDRAESIKNWLVANYGIDASRLRTAGYGPRRPITSSEDEAGWALNRRVEFKKIDDISSHH